MEFYREEALSRDYKRRLRARIPRFYFWFYPSFIEQPRVNVISCFPPICKKES